MGWPVIADTPAKQPTHPRPLPYSEGEDQRFRRAHIFRATTHATTRTTTPRIKTPATAPATRKIPQNNASTNRPTATERPITK